MLSLPKILLTILVIAGVWYGYKWLSRRGGVPAKGKARDESGTSHPSTAVDLVKCPDCGTYLPAGQDHDCAAKG